MGNGVSFFNVNLEELFYHALANVVQSVDTLTSFVEAVEAFVAGTAPPTAPSTTPGGSRPPNSYYWGTRLSSPGHAPGHVLGTSPLRVDINGKHLGYLHVDPSLHASVRELLKAFGTSQQHSAQRGAQESAHAAVVGGPQNS
jgi:hypothetical protein